MIPSFTIVEAPSVLGLFPQGVERLPEALLAAGLAHRLGARYAGRIEPPAYDPTRDPVTLLLNAQGIAAYSAALADAVGAVLDRGEFPIVLGGDCSILLGNLLALRRRLGRHGLLFLDGHADFYQPEAEPNGEVASMDLALATGRGPAILADLEGRRPLVRDEDVVLLGYRDGADAALHGSQELPPALGAVDLDQLRRRGASSVAADAVRHLTAESCDGFWIHLDVDVLDDALMPAVDYRMPGGLDCCELVTVLRAALGSGRAVGLDITIFNPALDPDGSMAQALVDAVVSGAAP